MPNAFGTNAPSGQDVKPVEARDRGHGPQRNGFRNLVILRSGGSVNKAMSVAKISGSCRMRVLKKAIVVLCVLAVVGYGGAWGLAQIFLNTGGTPTEPAAKVDAALIARGKYLADAGDCAACHTEPGGKPFAGGQPFATPIGTIYSTNITPDTATGIGRYSYADFVRAVRLGIAPGVGPLYPAMPFPSYAVISDGDMQALYAYFLHGIAPVRQADKAGTIPWPLSMRWPLAYWQFLFGRQAPFQPQAGHDAAWNRGAYLVEGLGHCGACHTPRGIAMQEVALNASNSEYLSGSVIDNWFAPSLRSEEHIGLGAWSVADIAQFLKTGHMASTAVFGSMTDVVEHSTQYLTDGDLSAIADYLKSLPAARSTDAFVPGKAQQTADTLKKPPYPSPGANVYMQACAGCHQPTGAGVPGTFPSLADNPIVISQYPESLIRVVLEGAPVAKVKSGGPTMPMPALGAMLSNKQIADVASFVRSAWGNSAPPVTEAQVASLRAATAPVAAAKK